MLKMVWNIRENHSRETESLSDYFNNIQLVMEIL